MTHLRFGQLIALALILVLTAGSLLADVKTEEKSLVKFGGALGKVMGLFGGKAAKEGVVNTVALKGNRMMTANDTTGEIIDLDEEKVYELDMRKKTYKVTTFDEIRRRMKQEQEKAEKQAQKEADKGQQVEFEIDFEAKETGQRKNINGFDTREVIMKITMREKGKTVEQAGGMVITSNMWLTEEANAAREIEGFQRRYMAKLGFDTHAKDMMQAMAFYPGLKEGMAKMEEESVNLQGTAVFTTMAVDTHKSQEQVAREKKEASSGDAPGGMIGGLARRIGRKQDDQQESQDKAQSSLMTATSELLRISTDVSPADVAVPAEFKQRK
jgi:hypothetical protein